MRRVLSTALPLTGLIAPGEAMFVQAVGDPGLHDCEVKLTSFVEGSQEGVGQLRTYGTEGLCYQLVAEQLRPATQAIEQRLSRRGSDPDASRLLAELHAVQARAVEKPEIIPALHVNVQAIGAETSAVERRAARPVPAPAQSPSPPSRRHPERSGRPTDKGRPRYLLAVQ